MNNSRALSLPIKPPARGRAPGGQVIIYAVAVVFLALSFVPIILMVSLSLKSNVQIYGKFWSPPWPIEWRNYSMAIGTLAINMVNSVIVVSVATTLCVALSTVSGYVFARLPFPGKEFLYILIISLMMVPSVLTLTPLFKLIEGMRLTNSWWALILPWVAGGQVFGTVLCRTFIATQPASIFEAARIDGANEFQALYKIAVPLALPIIATLMIMNMMSFYNDYIWPLMVIDSNLKQVITVAIRVFTSSQGATDIGAMMAGYVFVTIPLLGLFMVGSRFYMEGLASGAVKA
jgi:ABC-type glycerol-3-phosphate transport system permease component